LNFTHKSQKRCCW